MRQGHQITLPAGIIPLGIADRQRLSNLLAFGFLSTAFLLGAALRYRQVFLAGFPLNDGGLFVAMADDLLRNGFSIPEFTSYNQSQIPFGYPPLGFYLLAFIHQLTGLPLVEIIRWLPPLVSTMTIPVVYLLAGLFTRTRLQSAFAVLLFALLPSSHAWMTFGGGLTRSLGFLFLLICLYSLTRLYQTNRFYYWLLAGVSAGLTALSHLEFAWFGLFSALVFMAFLPSNRQLAVWQSMLAAAAALVLAGPWVAAVWRHHGIAPFAAAASTTNGFGIPHTWISSVSGEPWLQMIGVGAAFAWMALAAKGRWLLPVWYLIMPIIDRRASPAVLSVVIPLLLTVFFFELFLPWLRELAGPRTGNEAEKRANFFPALRVLFVAMLVLPTIFNALAYTFEQQEQNYPYVDGQTQGVMSWAAENTPAESSFLVLPTAQWSLDSAAEWFPWLAKRMNVSTVQGSEWLPNQEFYRRISQHEALLDCEKKTIQCIEDWADKTGRPFDYVLVPAAFQGALRARLEVEHSYQAVYSMGDAVLYRRMT